MKLEGNKKRLILYISKVLSWIILAILILIAGFLVYYVISSRIYASKGEEYRPKYSLYTIISPSMEPNIKVYDVIFNEKVTDLTTIHEGDIITFISTGVLSEGMTVTHRVIDIVETDSGIKFRTKGDNNIAPDSALADGDKVLSKVLFKIPQLGRVQFLLSSKSGWLFLIMLPAIGVIIYDIIKVLKLGSIKKKVDNILEKGKEKVDPNKIKEENQRKQKIRDNLKNNPLNNIPINELSAKEESDSNKIKTSVKKVKNKIKIIEPQLIPKVVEPDKFMMEIELPKLQAKRKNKKR